MSQLHIAVKQASEITDQVKQLADTLKEMLFNNAGHIASSAIDPFVFAITIFVLAAFVGYYVVWKVTPALHTPLMSITNAISGIIIIGAMIAASPMHFNLSSVLGYMAIFFASINIFGGLIVTKRMLEMFKKK